MQTIYADSLAAEDLRESDIQKGDVVYETWSDTVGLVTDVLDDDTVIFQPPGEAEIRSPMQDLKKAYTCTTVRDMIDALGLEDYDTATPRHTWDLTNSGPRFVWSYERSFVGGHPRPLTVGGLEKLKTWNDTHGTDHPTDYTVLEEVAHISHATYYIKA